MYCEVKTLEESHKSKLHSPALAMETTVKPRNQTIKVCQLCGNAGYTELLVTCSRCRSAFQHMYCMPVIRFQIPYSWHCEQCLRADQVVSKGKVHDLYDAHKSVASSHPIVAVEKHLHRMMGSLCGPDGAPKNFNIVKDARRGVKGFPSDNHVIQSSLRCPSLKAIENAKVKSLPHKEVTLARSKVCKGQPSLGESSRPKDCAKVTSHISRRLVGNKLTILGSKVTTEQCCNAEVDASLMKINEPSEIVTNDENTSTKTTKILGFPSSNCVGSNVSNAIDAPPLDTGVEFRKKSLGLTCSDVQSKRCDHEEIHLSKKFRMNIAESALNSRPASDAYWKGTFEVYGVYCPQELAAKAHEILKNIPVNLDLKIVPRIKAWPKLFQLGTPSLQDVGLFFIPAECDRSKEKYMCLMAWIDAHDSAMQTSVGDAELLIYSSTQLTTDCQRLDERTCLWGVFKHTTKRKHQKHNLETLSQVAAGIKDNNCPAQFADTLGAQDDVDMEIDMIGGIEVGRIDFPLPNHNGPPGFQRQIRRDASHAYMSAFGFT